LAEETKVKELYFWGRFLTNGRDYYVARGVTHPLPSDPLPPNGEARGTGVNFYTFWVCHDVLGDWQELPLITP
jgi:radial spoke head protein 4/6